MKIATWNLERPKQPKTYSAKNDLIQKVLGNLNADIFILTETNGCIQPGDQYQPFATRQLPYQEEGESLVTIWSKFPMTRVIPTRNPSTTVCVGLQTGRGELIVYGTVIGIRGYTDKDLDTQIEDWEEISQLGSICIAGDFNTSFSDNYRYTKEARPKILSCFEKQRINNLTAQRLECIDHIAISNSFVRPVECSVEEWNLETTSAVPSLSDHKGIWVEF